MSRWSLLGAGKGSVCLITLPCLLLSGFCYSDCEIHFPSWPFYFSFSLVPFVSCVSHRDCCLSVCLSIYHVYMCVLIHTYVCMHMCMPYLYVCAS